MQIDYPLSPKARKCGSGWVDLCPAHYDRSPSLSINIAADGKLLLHCFVGCTFESIVAAAGLSGSQAIRSVTRSDLEQIKQQQLEEEVQVKSQKVQSEVESSGGGCCCKERCWEW